MPPTCVAPTAQPLPKFKDSSIVTVDGVRIGLTGAAFDDSARASDPGDLRFLPTVATVTEQAQALRRDGRGLRRGRGPCHPRAGLRDFPHPHGRSRAHRSHPRSVHQLRRPHRHGRVELRRPLRHRDRRRDRREGGGRTTCGDLVAAVSRDRHGDGDARSRGGGGRRQIRGRAEQAARRADRHHRRRARQPRRDGAHARGRRSAISSPMPCAGPPRPTSR